VFSVVIPLYNKRPFIERTLRSVLAQRWQDFEVMVVDDGSTDNGLEPVRRLAAEDSRVRFMQVPNGGVSAARNRGAAATGRPWLAFLDADDEWHPEFLSVLGATLEKRPDVVLASTSYEVCGPEGARALRFETRGELAENVPFFDWALDVGPPIWTSATVVNRSHFEAVGGFDTMLTVGEDIHLWVRLLHRGTTLFVNRPLAVYRRDDAGSLSRSVSARALASRERLMAFLREQVRAGRVPLRYLNALREIHFCELVNSARYRAALRFYRQAPSFGHVAALKHVLRHMKRRLRPQVAA